MQPRQLPVLPSEDCLLRSHFQNLETFTPSSAAEDTTSLSSVAFSALSKTLVSKLAAPSSPPEVTA